MKNKILFLLLTTLISICFVACSPNTANGTKNTTNTTKNYHNQKISFPTETPYTIINDFSGASMSITEFSSEDNTITLDIAYSGENTLSYGTSYEIEIQIGDKWYTLNYDKEDQVGVAWHLKNNEVGTEQYNLDRYGTLQSGHYRIVKEVLNSIETGNYTTHYLTAEFDIE